MGPGLCREKIYGGTRLDWHTPHLLVIFDLPLSFIADTILLPLTIYEVHFFDRSLHDAALAGNLHTISVVLDAGKSVDTTDEYGHTLLMSATVGLHSPIVEELLRRGAKVNALSNSETSALFYALLTINTHRHIANDWSKGQREEATKILFLLQKAGGKLHNEFQKGWSDLTKQILLGHGIEIDEADLGTRY